jgi:hypothetical protein
MIITLLTVLFCSSPVLGADGADASSDGSAASAGDTAAQAEYIRLSQELEKLATRNAWPGVERTYLLLVATGVTPKFEDHLIGAHGARAIGDITSARQRLLLANELKEDREVIDWLWEIDSTYGQVFIACDVGKGELKAEAMPFEPDQAHAVEFAALKVVEGGLFEGYLPQGKYYFADYEVKVQPRVQGTRIDLRTEASTKPPKKNKKDK